MNTNHQQNLITKIRPNPNFSDPDPHYIQTDPWRWDKVYLFSLWYVAEKCYYEIWNFHMRVQHQCKKTLCRHKNGHNCGLILEMQPFFTLPWADQSDILVILYIQVLSNFRSILTEWKWTRLHGRIMSLFISLRQKSMLS